MPRGKSQRLVIPPELSYQGASPKQCCQQGSTDDTKEQDVTHVTNDIKAILLHTDSRKVEISVVALQDSGTLTRVIDRLLEMSSADKKEPIPRQKSITKTKKRILKPNLAYHSVRKKIQRQSPRKTKGDSINHLSDSISQLSISPTNDLAVPDRKCCKSKSPFLSLDCKEGSRSATLTSTSSVDTVSPDKHRLAPDYASKLRRRQALARRRKPSHEASNLPRHVPFDKNLPLDLPRKNVFNRYIQRIYDKRDKDKRQESRRQHYLQRAHIPIDHLSNIPISEQIHTYINPKEIQAYRRSGMSLLNMDIIDQNNQPKSPSVEPSSPSFIENGHDIWYEDLSPPTDAVSVFVYWWGYEVYLPKEVLDNMRKKGSFTNSLLAIIASITVTVPVIQPFIKLISAFISMESSASDLLHSPQGTVLTATWLLPFLVLPRPWY
ncbi:hypothetical protein DSO57_1001037 [Entomophthora muscae]|uniref:Uncharacterized protein n=1 Tax=Entomophthora muscae TaxID=34485 RepID=A0ACC2UUW1_9FUNG|nr:hypothetical protein DSO57_1001037 [Entomophthora muscae]